MPAASTYNLRITVDGKDQGAGKMLDSLGEKAGNFGKALSNIGAGMTAGITLPLVGVAAAAISASTDLNSAMANIASLGVPTETVNEFKTAIQDMSIELGTTTDDLAAGMYQVVSAFGNTSDSIKILEINAKTAAAGLATTEEAIALTSAVTKGYGDTSAEAVGKVSDLALQTVALGQTTLPELAGAIGAVVPLSSALGVSQEELFAVMATGTGVIGGASEVGTGYRGVLQALMAPTKDTEALLEKMGYASGQAAIEQLGFMGATKLLTAAAKKSGKPLTNYIGSIEGVTFALAFTEGLQENYTANLEKMGAAAGATDAAFAAQTQGINAGGFAWKQLTAATQVILQRLGDGLAPALGIVLQMVTPLVDKVLKLATAFANADPATQKWIVTLAGLAIAAGPVLFVVGKLFSALSLIGKIGLIASPFGLIIAGAATLIALDVGGIRTKLVALFNRITAAAPFASGAITEITKALNGLPAGTDNVRKFTTALTGSASWGFIAAFAVERMGAAAEATGSKVAGIAAAIGTLVDANVTIDAKAGITEVDWTGSLTGAGTYKYSATTGITNIDWTGSLGEQGQQAFSYDSAAGIKKVIWDEENFTFTYDAAAAVTTVNFAQGIFKGYYSATATVESALWGVFYHSYDVGSTITEVAWGAYSYTYDVFAKVSSVSVLWGIWTHTYDAQAKVSEAGILWGLFTHVYDVQAGVSTFKIMGMDVAEFGSYLNGLFASMTLSADPREGLHKEDPARDLMTGSGWTWPTLPTFEWPTLPEWKWPDYLTFKWPTFPSFKWPQLPDWEWPSIPIPSWWGDGSVPQSGGGLGNPGGASGISHSRGGLTWVGERGPELVNLPRGSQVWPHSSSVQMAAAGGGPNIVINATLNNGTDVRMLARQIRDVWERESR